MSSCVAYLFVFRMQIALWKMADHFPSQKVLLCVWLDFFFLYLNYFLSPLLMSFDIGILIINATSFCGVPDALWVCVSSSRVMWHPSWYSSCTWGSKHYGLLLNLQCAGTCRQGDPQRTGSRDCGSPPAIRMCWGEVLGGAHKRDLVKVQISWAHLENSDLVPLGGTQEYVFFFKTGVPGDWHGWVWRSVGIKGTLPLNDTPVFLKVGTPASNMLGGFCDLQIPGLSMVLSDRHL